MTATPHEPEKRQIPASVPNGLADRLKEYANAQGIPQSAIVAWAVQAYLDEAEKTEDAEARR